MAFKLRTKNKKMNTLTFPGRHCTTKEILFSSLIETTNYLEERYEDFDKNTIENQWQEDVKYSYPELAKVQAFSTFFSAGEELGIWDENWRLTPLAKKVAKNEINIKNYFDIVISNYVIEVDNKTYNPLALVLIYCQKYNQKIIDSELIKKVFRQIYPNVGDHHASYLIHLLKPLSFFLTQKACELKLMDKPKILLTKCNLKYHNQNKTVFDTYIRNVNDYNNYLTTPINVQNNDIEIYLNENYLISNNFNYDRLEKYKNVKNEIFPFIPHQKIYYGAPGTGKSYKLNQDAIKIFGREIRRITFHHNSLYANFIGSYKPYVISNDRNSWNKNEITYIYVPGLLIETLIQAWSFPRKKFLLIIEEINRANAAAVFGDFFQLLDRNKIGNSEYPIKPSKELQDYLQKEVLKITNKRSDFSEIYFPNNFYIWATMNSADQGVTPLDTAFKRRWTFEYVDINENANNVKNKYYFNLKDTNDKRIAITWNDFRETINNYLSKTVLINEDKLMGVYFISKNDLEECENDPDRLTNIIKNKVLMYLYEDVCRTYRKKVFNMDKAFSTSGLLKNFNKEGLKVFNSDLEQKLRDKINSHQNNESDEEEN